MPDSEQVDAKAVALTQLVASPAAFAGKTLWVRGFLYQTAEGRWFLSSEPSLRSCCVGSAAREHEQVEVLGNIHSKQFGVVQVIQGRMEISEFANSLQLHDASIIAEDALSYCPFCITTWLLLSLALVSAIYWTKGKSQASKIVPK